MSLNTARTRRSLTPTANVCSAVNPSGSSAVIVTAADPYTTGVSVNSAPATDTTTTSGSDDDARYVSTSPSRSSKYGATSNSVALPPSSRVRSGITPTAIGASFTGAMVTSTAAAPPPAPPPPPAAGGVIRPARWWSAFGVPPPPPAATRAIPWAGFDTDATRRPSPSGSVSFASTSITTRASSAVAASSSSAVGGSFTLVTSTTTRARASAPCGSPARRVNSYRFGSVS